MPLNNCMDKRIRENACFYASGLIATLIAVLGICANSIYAKSGGYAIAFGCVVVALLCGFFIYAITPNLTQTRTKGMIALSCIISFLYTIIFIVVDIGKTKIYKWENVDGTIVSSLTGFGNTVLVFEILCIIASFLLVLRMLLNLFGKEIAFYEKWLGTPSVRYKERKEIALELPEKDTDKLINSAKRAIELDPKLRKAIEDSVFTENDAVVNKMKETKTTSVTKKVEREYVESKSDVVNEPEIVDIEKNKLDEIVIEPVEPESEKHEILEEVESVTESVEDNHEEPAENTVEDIEDDDSTTDEPQSEPAQPVDSTIFADSIDVGEVNEFEINEDLRNTNLIHHITEQVDSDDDDIYSDFNYDDDDK